MDAEDPLLGLGGSAYLQLIHGLKTGTPPRCDLEKEKELHWRVAVAHLFRRGQERPRLQRRRPGRGAGGVLHLPAIARETPRLIGAEIDLAGGQAAHAWMHCSSAKPKAASSFR